MECPCAKCNNPQNCENCSALEKYEIYLIMEAEKESKNIRLQKAKIRKEGII